jgi:hypothetical protein
MNQSTDGADGTDLAHVRRTLAPFAPLQGFTKVRRTLLNETKKEMNLSSRKMPENRAILAPEKCKT